MGAAVSSSDVCDKSSAAGQVALSLLCLLQRFLHLLHVSGEGRHRWNQIFKILGTSRYSESPTRPKAYTTFAQQAPFLQYFSLCIST